MRSIEYCYLTKGLPLKVNRNIIEDSYGDLISLFNGDTVYFEDLGFGNEIIVKTSDKKVRIEKEQLNIDYDFIPFPFYATDLKSIYENENDIYKIKKGSKLVTGDTEGTYNDIGGGQIVEVLNISITNGEIVEILIKDQFGYENQGTELYWYDESKLNKEPMSIINPLSQIESELKINIQKKDITSFAKVLSNKLYLEEDNCPLINKHSVTYALIDAITEWNNKAKKNNIIGDDKCG